MTEKEVSISSQIVTDLKDISKLSLVPQIWSNEFTNWTVTTPKFTVEKSTITSCSESTVFKYEPDDRLSWLEGFRGFPSSLHASAAFLP
jgi:hypothetical protein